MSSIETIFIWGGMNSRIAFRVVVFPLAVPPQISMDCPFSIASHRYAIISGDIVLNRTRSSGVKGFSRNLRIVNDDPRFVTCIPRVAWSREPSGTVASSMGCATEMCFPHRCASHTTKESSSTAVSNLRLLGTLPYFRW
ncbi:MAG: hypothetical protein A3K65_00315 [Euryarchaeota archaeon RBG_16_68_12]|nr:MAG: hypothetical protein A3K65_00315 [Euryarchaeota archaeon RBG_16_68_12]